jgi:hypothetical protein
MLHKWASTVVKELRLPTSLAVRMPVGVIQLCHVRSSGFGQLRVSAAPPLPYINANSQARLRFGPLAVGEAAFGCQQNP